MIEEKLLISYLKKQKREYNEQVVILQKELTSLIERIESGKFDVIENPKKEGIIWVIDIMLLIKKNPVGRV